MCQLLSFLQSLASNLEGFVFVFEAGSHVTKAGLELAM